MSSLTFQAVNRATLPQGSLDQPFTLTTPPKTDIWKRSETDDVFNAPYIFTNVRIAAFSSIATTVSGPWKTQFDQGGLILVLPNKNGPERWIKAGIEYFNGKPMLGVVGTDRYSDWSLCPMPEGAGNEATFEAVREDQTLWVYVIGKGAEKQALREVRWAFLGLGEAEEVKVGVYAAKPTPEEADADAKLQVQFEGLDVKIKS